LNHHVNFSGFKIGSDVGNSERIPDYNEFRTASSRSTIIDNRAPDPIPEIKPQLDKIIFNLEINLPDKNWVWMSIPWHQFQEALADELKEHVDPFIPKMTFAFIHQNPNDHIFNSNPFEITHDIYPWGSRVKEFAYSLWAMNSRFLETLGDEILSISMDKKLKNPYLKENKRFMKWLQDFMYICKTNDQRCGNQGKYIYEMILKGIHFNQEEWVYQFFQERITTKKHYVTQSQLMMNEAATLVLGSYYKNWQYEKWTQIFPEDIMFLEHMTDFGNGWKQRPRNMIVGKVLPWDSFHFGAKFTKKKQKVKSLKIPVKIYLNTENREPFFMGQNDQNLLEFLSQSKMKKNHISFKLDPMPELITSFDDYIQFLTGEKFKLGKLDHIPEFLSIYTRDFKQKLDFLLQLLWTINTELLEALGCEIGSRYFFEEMKSLELFFTSLLAQNNAKNTKEKDFCRNQAMNFCERLSELMTKYFLFDHKMKICQVKDSQYLNSSWSDVLEEDKIRAEIVVEILGNYYKSQSYLKWLSIFQKDELFLHALIRVTRDKLYQRRPDLEKDSLKNIESLNLIPWKKPFDNSCTNIPSRVKRYFQMKSAMILANWIKLA
jgi:hypothetical protein